MDNNIVISFIYAAVLAGVPLIYGTLGEIITEKAGNLNLGVEGMMYMGAIGAFMGGMSGSGAVALLLAFVLGMFGALMYAFLTVTLRANQNVTGLTLTIFGTGLANLLGDHFTVTSASRSATLPDSTMAAFGQLNIPGLTDIPGVGKLLFNYNMFVYVGIALCIIAGIYINRTFRGRNLRAVGENPAAADAMGINVTRYKYVHIMLGGGICGLGGAYVSLVTCGGIWTYNCINGLGWIAVALVIFAGWSPYRVIIGSLVFGTLRILRLYVPTSSLGIPSAFFSALPFIATAVVLVISSISPSRKHQQPQSCGLNYYREDR